MSPLRDIFYFQHRIKTMDVLFTKEIILENSRVLLRPLAPDDSANLLPVATAQTDLVQYSPYQIHTPALLDAYINKSLQEREDHFRYPFAVFDKKAQAYAGSTSYANVSNKDR